MSHQIRPEDFRQYANAKLRDGTKVGVGDSAVVAITGEEFTIVAITRGAIGVRLHADTEGNRWFYSSNCKKPEAAETANESAPPAKLVRPVEMLVRRR